MRYRKFGKLGWDVSVLGFGVSPACTEAQPDGPEFVRMIRYAIDHGVNYVDLGHPYDLMEHERQVRLVGEALRDGYRERTKVAVTLPAHLVHPLKDPDRILDLQLTWLQTDHVDFCIVGRLNRENWPGLKEMGLLPWAEEALREGRIGGLGFSFHDHYQVLKAILTDYDKWVLCQFQYSYMDVDHDPGVSGLAYAADQGLAVVVSEPLRSGRLTREQPESVRRLWESAAERRTPVEWGLRWVWNHPEVSVAVTAMDTMEQVVEDITLAGKAEPDGLTVYEEVLVSRVRDAYRASRPVPCPSCRACMPCPEGIDVPRVFEIYNDALIYDDVAMARNIYLAEEHKAAACTGCGACERACAKRLAIMDRLKEVGHTLEG